MRWCSRMLGDDYDGVIVMMLMSDDSDASDDAHE